MINKITNKGNQMNMTTEPFTQVLNNIHIGEL